MYPKYFANTLLKVGTRIYRWRNEVISRHVAQAKRIFILLWKLITFFIKRIKLKSKQIIEYIDSKFKTTIVRKDIDSNEAN